MVAAVVSGLGVYPRVVVQGFVDQLPQLRERLTQDQRLIPGDMYLTQRLDDQRVALSAA